MIYKYFGEVLFCVWEVYSIFRWRIWKWNTMESFTEKTQLETSKFTSVVFLVSNSKEKHLYDGKSGTWISITVHYWLRIF